MAFNHENLNVYQRMLPLNVKVGIWTGAWDSKHAICDQLDAKGLRHGLIDDRGDSTMMQSTKLATKRRSPHKPGRTALREGSGFRVQKNAERDSR